MNPLDEKSRRKAESQSRPGLIVALKNNLSQFGSRILPHDTKKTTCPPAALTSGAGPLIMVASLMRSGTHLLLDTLFNNFPLLHRSPLFVDYDAYERGRFAPEPLISVTGTIIKTHFPETSLAEPYAATLANLASRAIVLTPRRPAVEVRRSLAKWGQKFTAAEFSEIEERFDKFWTPFSPRYIEFSTLLDFSATDTLIKDLAKYTGLAPRDREKPVVPARSRMGVYFDKTLTRALGYHAPRINTTIGYRLRPKQEV